MASKYEFQFNLTGKADNLLSTIKKVSNAFKDIKLDEKTGNALKNQLSQVEKAAEQFSKRLENGLTTERSVDNLERDFLKLQTVWDKFVSGLKDAGIDTDKFIPKETITTIDNLVERYKNLLDLQKQQNQVLNKQSNTSKKIDQLQTKRKEIENTPARRNKNEIKADLNANEQKLTDLGYTTKGDLSSLASVQRMRSENEEIKKLLQERKALLKENDLTFLESDKNKALATKDSQISAAQDEYKNYADQLAKYGNEIKIEQQSLAQETQKFGVNLDNLSQSAAQLENSLKIKPAEELKNNLEQIDPLVKQTDEALEDLGDTNRREAESFSEWNQATKEIDQVYNRFSRLFTLDAMITTFTRVVRDAFQTVKDLDSVMTETAVVTDYTVGDMWDKLNEYTERANQLGATTKGAYETATLYYQQGLNDQETADLSIETMKMARIANMDYAKATDSMTAALRGFNLELNAASAQRVNDVYSKLAAITASDTQEISTAMEKTASLAHNAGMDLETTAVYLSQALETTREAPENIGTAMKTILARFQKLTKDPDTLTPEVNELLEGETVDANETEAALRKAGVALRDATGQFRDAKDIMLELNAVWDTLDKNTQRYIATQTAGSRQQSRFIAMMQDYGRTQELLGAAENSNGASQEQFDKTLESMEAKLNKLSNAWNEFTMNIANNKVLKVTVDGLTKIISIIDNLLNTLGDVPGMIAGIAGLFGALTTGGRLLDRVYSGLLDSITRSGARAGASEAAERIAQQLADRRLYAQAFANLNLGDILRNSLSTSLKTIKGTGKGIITNISKFLFGNGIDKNLTNSVKQEANSIRQGLLQGFTDVESHEKLKNILGDSNYQQYTNALINGNNAEADSIAALTKSQGLFTAIQVLGNKEKQKTIALSLSDAIAKYKETGAVTKLSLAEFIAVAATEDLNTALGMIGATPGMLGVQAAVMVITAALAGFIIHQQNVQKACQDAEEAIQDYNDSISEIEDNINTIQDLSAEFTTLSKGVDQAGRNISLSADEYARYKEIVQQLVDINPSLIEGYDAEGNAIINKNEALEESIKLQKEYANNARIIYTSIPNMNKIYTSVQEDAKESIKELDKVAASIKVTTDSVYKTVSESGNVTIKKANIDELKNGAVSSIQAINDYYDRQIENLGDWKDSKSKQKKYQKYQEERMQDMAALNEAKSLTKELETVSQPLTEVLTAYAQRTDITGTGKSMFQGISDELQSYFSEGIKQISMMSDTLNTSQMREAVTKLYNDMSTGANGMTQYAIEMRKVNDAKEKFLDSARGEEDVKKYTNAVNSGYEYLLQLAQDYRDKGGAVNAAIADSFEATADSIKDYGEEMRITLSEALNPMKDLISAAEALDDTLSELEDHDYYAAADTISGVIETALDSKNTAGKGSLTFWKTAESVLGSVYTEANAGNKALVQSQLQMVQGWTDGENGARSFMQYLNAHKNDEAFKDFYTFTTEGNEITFDYDDTKLEELTEALGISQETFAALLQNARQFMNINFSNVDQLQTALEESNSFLTGKSKVDITTESGKTKTVNKGYIWKSEVESAAEAQDLTYQEGKNAIEDLHHTVLSLDMEAQDLADSFNDILGKNTIQSENASKDSGTKVISTMIAQNQTSADTGKLFLKWAKAGYKFDFEDKKLQGAYDKLVEVGENATDKQIEEFQTLLDEQYIENSNDIIDYDPAIQAIDGTNSRLDKILAVLGVLPTKFTKEEWSGLKERGEKNQEYTTDSNLLATLSDEDRTNRVTNAINDNQILKDKMDALDIYLESNPWDHKAWKRKKALEKTYNNNQAFIDTSARMDYFTSNERTADDEESGYAKVNRAIEENQKNKKSTLNIDDYQKLGAAMSVATDDQAMLTAATEAYIAAATGNNDALEDNIDILKDNDDALNAFIEGMLQSGADLSSLLSYIDDDEKVIEIKEKIIRDKLGENALEKINTIKDKQVKETIIEYSISGDYNSTDYETWFNGLNDKQKIIALEVQAEVQTVNGEEVTLSPNLDISKLNTEEVAAALSTGVQAGMNQLNTEISPSVDPNFTQLIKDQITAANGTKVTITPDISTASVSVNYNNKPVGTITVGGGKKGSKKGSKSDANGQNLGSVAKGAQHGRLGPNNNGGLTLTGELGPELVWEPNKSISYLVGENGPEMRNLPGNAVVWPADQTKQIMSSAAKGKNFGSMSSATMDASWLYGNTIVNSNSGTSSGGSSGNKSGSDSTSKKWENTYERWYNAVKKVDKLLRKADQLQQQYEAYLKDVTKTGKQAASSVTQLFQTYQDTINESKSIMSQINSAASTLDNGALTYYKNGEEKKENKRSVTASKYAYWDNNAKRVVINYDAIASITDTGLGSAVDEYIKKLEGYQSDYEKYEDEVNDSLKAIQDLQQQLIDDAVSAVNVFADAIEEERQAEIDKLETVNDSINDSNDKLINAINKSIDKIRQARENQKTEEDLNTKRKQLEILKRDTSGANDVKIKELEKEIADAEEDYTDSLVDQQISNLEENLDAASEQRQQMIDILQEQLDWAKGNGKLSKEAQSKLSQYTDLYGNLTDAGLKYLRENSKEWQEAGALERIQMEEEWKKAAKQMYTYNTQGDNAGNLSQDKSDALSEGARVFIDGEEVTSDITSGEESGYMGGTIVRDNNDGTSTVYSSYIDSEGNIIAGDYKATDSVTTTEENTDAKNAYIKALKATKKKKPAKVTTTDINTLLSTGKTAKYGPKTVIHHLLTKDPWTGKDPFTWKNMIKTLVKTKTLSRYNLLKTWPDNKYLIAALKLLGKPNTPKDIKKSKSYEKANKLVAKYKDGGLANYTGPAWLDGTPTKPEMVLNAKDTANFIELKNILSDLLKSTPNTTTNTNDLYFDINVNVEQMANDYDADQLVKRVKQEITKSMTYRNVNTVSRRIL